MKRKHAIQLLSVFIIGVGLLGMPKAAVAGAGDPRCEYPELPGQCVDLSCSSYCSGNPGMPACEQYIGTDFQVHCGCNCHWVE